MNKPSLLRGLCLASVVSFILMNTGCKTRSDGPSLVTSDLLQDDVIASEALDQDIARMESELGSLSLVSTSIEERSDSCRESLSQFSNLSSLEKGVLMTRLARLRAEVEQVRGTPVESPAAPQEWNCLPYQTPWWDYLAKSTGSGLPQGEATLNEQRFEIRAEAEELERCFAWVPEFPSYLWRRRIDLYLEALLVSQKDGKGFEIRQDLALTDRLYLVREHAETIRLAALGLSQIELLTRARFERLLKQIVVSGSLVSNPALYQGQDSSAAVESLNGIADHIRSLVVQIETAAWDFEQVKDSRDASTQELIFDYLGPLGSLTDLAMELASRAQFSRQERVGARTPTAVDDPVRAIENACLTE